MKRSRPKITPTGDVAPERMTNSQRNRLFWLAVIVLAVAGAFADTRHNPFVSGDFGSIIENESLRHVATALQAPHGTAQVVEARPVLNASFALNVQTLQYRVGGFHTLNLVIHALAAVVLFELLRLTFRLPRLRKRFDRDSNLIAGVTALIWAVHPLQTESVAYIVQRAESLAGLFVLLAFYCLIRSVESTGPAFWRCLTVACLILGVGTNEVAVAAIPLLILFESTFLATPFAVSLRRHKVYYVGLAGVILALVGLLASAGVSRHATTALAPDATYLRYLLTQPGAIVTYLRLSVFPYPLVFDYGAEWVKDPLSIAGPVLLAAVFLALSILAVLKFPRTGFLAAWFWVLLAATSLVPDYRETIAEHRMYLPLLAVILGIVVIAWRLLPRKILLGSGLCLGIGLALFTALRNQDYATPIQLYGDTVTHRPNNPWARVEYGSALGSAGKTKDASVQFEQAIALAPTYAEAHYDLALVQAPMGRVDDAISHYRIAIANRPHYTIAEFNLAVLYYKKGRFAEALEPLNAVLAENPRFFPARITLGEIYASTNQMPQAHDEFARVWREDPQNSEAVYNLAMTDLRLGNKDEGLPLAEKALALNPRFPEGHHNLGILYARSGDLKKALPHLAAAVQLRPDFAEAQVDYGNALALTGRDDLAIHHLQEAIHAKPTLAPAYYSLGNLYARANLMADAVEQYNLALRLKPDYPAAKQALAEAQRLQGLSK